MGIAYALTVISGFASLLPAIAGWWRLPHIRPAFYPFILLLTANFIAELVSFLSIRHWGINTHWYHIYALVSALLILWQLYTWTFLSRFARLLQIIALLLCILWILTRHQSGESMVLTIWLLAKDACIAGCCFYLLYRRIPDLSFGIHKDAVVLISSGWLILFVFDAVIELLIAWGRWMQTPALAFLQPVFSIINIVVITIHLIAVIWIPPKTPS